ncbi:hypothetical protein TIFTF001_037359 [Ficus carica]|uniref:Uncharacterized protein n=1 Tax=Ficus carica TaxID=3494 RepID=A0AA88E8L6_FICCA|nr:hypothetical protein TIFTF001_037359 [Ficus carica]
MRPQLTNKSPPTPGCRDQSSRVVTTSPQRSCCCHHWNHEKEITSKRRWCGVAEDEDREALGATVGNDSPPWPRKR